MGDQVLADIIRPGTSRNLDFIILGELRKRTGINQYEIPIWTISELLSNSLDTDATKIQVKAETVKPYDVYTVSDNGTIKITRESLKLILDFSNKASSKRGFQRVSRGYLGNALKCVFGYSYALAESKGIDNPCIEVESHGTLYTIQLTPNKVTEQIEHKITETQIKDNDVNRFTVKYPIDRSYSRGPDPVIESNNIINLVTAASIVNPTRQITYEVWGNTKTLGKPENAEQLRQETSILWYHLKGFTELLYDYVRAAPETQIKDFISLFRGYTSKKKHREILHHLTKNHDSQKNESVQFLPSTPIKDLPHDTIEALYAYLVENTKQISKRSIDDVLGCVGEAGFKQIEGCKSLKYILLKERVKLDMHKPIGYPFLIELAIIEREPDDQGIQLYQCVNFMATTESLFSRSFNIEYRLGRSKITEDQTLTIVIHLVSPVLEWLNYGKTGLSSTQYTDLIKKAFDKLIPIPKAPKQPKQRKIEKPVSWVPSGKIGKPIYEARLRDFAKEIKILDKQRTQLIPKLSSRGWSYTLEGFGRITKDEFNKAQKAINDCRKLGYLPIDFTAQDQDETRRFTGIHEAASPIDSLTNIKYQVSGMLESLPSYSTDYWTGEKYYVMMCVEKGDIKKLFEPICRDYHVPIVSSKGWAPITLRANIAELAKQAEKRGLMPVLLLFYDHDPAGLKISNKFKKNLRDLQKGTGYNPEGLLIHRFGLNSWDIENYNLTWIENLKTSSGKEARAPKYIAIYGRRKCETNSLFKNDETAQAGLKLCREAIESYYGKDALQRFRDKEKKAKEKLSSIYKDPIWENIDTKLQEIINEYKEPENIEDLEAPEPIHNVLVDNEYYAVCTECGNSFNHLEIEPGTIVRCRYCNAQLKIIWEVA